MCVDRCAVAPYFLHFMSHLVTVDLGDRSYPIHIGAGLLGRLDAYCKDLELGLACMVVSDSQVDPLYGACSELLENEGFSVVRAVVPAGEASKVQDQVNDLYLQALEGGLDRHSFIIALGGGVVGDLAGFVAASYLRGIKYVQAPTSLLAMVDSAIGGKTGINLPQGKNLIGAFHQPSLVVIDTKTLSTLPAPEYAAGLAEVVKYGVIRDADLFSELEEKADGVLARDEAVMEPIIASCCEIKADVVGLDEREEGLRSILNFGHTVGHAIEQASGYGRYLHGEAISIGMNFAGQLSARERGFPQKEHDRLVALLTRLGLPVKISDLAWDDVRAAMSVDKKSLDRTPRFVLADRLGIVAFGCEVAEDILEEIWHGCCE